MEKKLPEIPIHDIKPLLEIQEYSLYYLIALIILGLVVFAAIVYFIVKYFKERNKFNIRKEHFEKLNAIDFRSAKTDAYDITYYGATFKDDGPRQSEMFQNLTQRLEIYKYKKSVDDFDAEIKAYINLYKDMIDV